MKKYYINRIALITVAVCLLAVPASAGGLADSTLGVGVRQLFSDVSAYLMILCPTAGGAAAVYFAIRRAMADEQDGKLSMLPWDYNLAFGGFHGNNATSSVNDPIDDVLSDRPMQA